MQHIADCFSCARQLLPSCTFDQVGKISRGQSILIPIGSRFHVDADSRDFMGVHNLYFISHIHDAFGVQRSCVAHECTQDAVRAGNGIRTLADLRHSQTSAIPVRRRLPTTAFAPEVPLKRNKDPKILVFTSFFLPARLVFSACIWALHDSSVADTATQRMAAHVALGEATRDFGRGALDARKWIKRMAPR